MNDETDELDREARNSMQRIQGLYAAAQAGLQQSEKVLRTTTSLYKYWFFPPFPAPQLDVIYTHNEDNFCGSK